MTHTTTSITHSPNFLAIVFKACRPPFLILTPVTIFVAWALAVQNDVIISVSDLILAFIGGMFAHVSVNTFNEYFDFKSGLDHQTQKTPFSGGSGALVEKLNEQDAIMASKYVLNMAIFSAFFTFLVGVHFVIELGNSIIPLGLFGMFIVVAYTRWLNRLPFACWLSPGLGFGPLMIIGTYFVLSGSYNADVLWVSFIPMLMANNLLLLNQFPDIEADKLVGRHHIPIAYGLVFSAHLYGLTILINCILLSILCYLEILPMISLVAVIPILIAFVVYANALKFAKADRSSQTEKIESFLPFMGVNVAVTLMTPLLLGVTIMM